MEQESDEKAIHEIRYLRVEHLCALAMSNVFAAAGLSLAGSERQTAPTSEDEWAAARSFRFSIEVFGVSTGSEVAALVKIPYHVRYQSMRAYS
jgi:hypothetical protein